MRRLGHAYGQALGNERVSAELSMHKAGEPDASVFCVVSSCTTTQHLCHKMHVHLMKVTAGLQAPEGRRQAFKRQISQLMHCLTYCS